MVPTGDRKGRFRHDNHPVSRIWFRELDSGYWWRYAVTAPTQNGKTLMGYVIPVCYHLFELEETVIIGLPDMRMANDKWERDLKPIIKRNWPHLMPTRGEGSKGGKIKSSVTFLNGVMLRFMTGGGGDKGRAGFPGCRVVAVTETDGMDEPGESSREADKVKQIEARTRSYPEPRRVSYLECTPSIEEGKIWQEYTNGSRSRLVRPCPHCGEWVSPEREHLKGWQEAEDEEEAREKSAWHCPACDHPWTQSDREYGWKHLRLVHRGQEVTEDGQVVGPRPRTRTLGFRWGAIDNPFETAGRCGAEEWNAKRAKDRENAEKEICQWTNAIPYKSPDTVVIELEPEIVASRVTEYKRGIVPAGCIGIAAGVDTHKRDLYWEAKAILLDVGEQFDAELLKAYPDLAKPSIRLHVIDHGVLKLEPHQLSKQAIINGLIRLHKQFGQGWLDEKGRKWMASQVWIDSGYAPHKMPVYHFCAAANKGLHPRGLIWRPAKGHGEGQLRTTPYRAPENLQPMQTQSSNVVYIGRDYHIVRIKQGKVDWLGVQLVHVNSDCWKTAFHEGYMIEPGESGSITLFVESSPDRDMYEAQVCGEVQREKFVRDRGTVLTWHQVSANHYLDAGYLSTAASDYVVENAKWLTGKPVARKRAEDYAQVARKRAEDYAQRPKVEEIFAYSNRPVPR